MDELKMKSLFRDLRKIHPDAECIRLADYSYGMQTSFVITGGEENIAEEFVPGTPTWDWFKKLDEFLVQYPYFGGGDFNDE